MCAVAHTFFGIGKVFVSRRSQLYWERMGYGERYAKDQPMEPECVEGRTRPALTRGAPPV